MATAETVTKALTETKKAPPTLQSLIITATKELGKALPAHMGPERLVRIALTCIRINPELAKCTPASLLGSLFVLAQLGLEPIAGRAWLLPFKNKRKDPATGKWSTVSEVQAIVGYRGLVDLFYRHDKAVLLSWGVVREKDDFDYERGTQAFLKHKEAKGNRGTVVGYWVMAELKNGGKGFHYMSADECLEHGKEHSKTWLTKEWSDESHGMVDCVPHWAEKSPWKTDPDSMSLKTVLIQLAKVIPMSFELQTALAADETSRDYRAGIDDALDLPTTTDWSDEPFDAEPVPAGDPKAAAAKPAQAAKPTQGFIIERTTRKDVGNGITRTFAYIGGVKYFTDDINMGVALHDWKDKRTAISLSSESKEEAGAFRILEAEPFKAA